MNKVVIKINGLVQLQKVTVLGGLTT